MGAATQCTRALAGQNSGTDRNEYLFRAARAYLAGHRPRRSCPCSRGARTAPDKRNSLSKKPLLEVDLAPRTRNRANRRGQRIGTLSEPRTAPEAVHYWRFEAAGSIRCRARPNDAVSGPNLPGALAAQRARATTESYQPPRLTTLTQSERNIRIDPTLGKPTPTIRGWLELGPIAAAGGSQPKRIDLPMLMPGVPRYPKSPSQ